MKLLFVASALLVLIGSGGALGQSGAASTGTAPIVENWDTDEGGAMQLKVSPDTLEGTYDLDNGRVSATLKDGVWVGYWMQDTSEQQCDDARFGTTYWGRLDLTFDARRQHFDGVWSYCDAKPISSDTWVGDRTDGASAAPDAAAASSAVAVASASESVSSADGSASASETPGPFKHHHH